jgi:hypothetical protein
MNNKHLCSVNGISIVQIDTGDKKLMYYINDGVYGSFNCVLYDHHVPEPHLMGTVSREYLEPLTLTSCLRTFSE